MPACSWVNRMADHGRDTFNAPRSITLPTVLLAAIMSAAFAVGGIYVLWNEKIATAASDISELKPRVRSLEDEKLRDQFHISELQERAGNLVGSLETSRKDLGDRLAAVEKELVKLGTIINSVIAASNTPLPGERAKKP